MISTKSVHKQAPLYPCSYLAAYRSDWTMLGNVLNEQTYIQPHAEPDKSTSPCENYWFWHFSCAEYWHEHHDRGCLKDCLAIIF